MHSQGCYAHLVNYEFNCSFAPYCMVCDILGRQFNYALGAAGENKGLPERGLKLWPSDRNSQHLVFQPFLFKLYFYIKIAHRKHKVMLPFKPQEKYHIASYTNITLRAGWCHFGILYVKWQAEKHDSIKCHYVL